MAGRVVRQTHLLNFASTSIMESSSMQRNFGKGNSNKRVRSQSLETGGEIPPSQITSNLKRLKLTHMQKSQDEAVQDVPMFVRRTGDEVNLSGMTYAAGAGLDTRKRCLPGTRTEILSQIMGWINNSGDDVPPVLWLSGPAGTGKSAIAHTIAGSFIDEGGVGACYSFDRDRDADHRHDKVFSTIARDLADRHPGQLRHGKDRLDLLQKAREVCESRERLRSCERLKVFTPKVLTARDSRSNGISKAFE
ncbi:hypothetical protein DFH29DRAFT_860592 [Suillus ampliporus]|nr:hypothetical protein DFH29DRAFT_860592 [Suillus ampliporus]